MPGPMAQPDLLDDEMLLVHLPGKYLQSCSVREATLEIHPGEIWLLMRTRLSSMVSPSTTNDSTCKASSVFFSLLIYSLRSSRVSASKLRTVLPQAEKSLSLASA